MATTREGSAFAEATTDKPGERLRRLEDTKREQQLSGWRRTNTTTGRSLIGYDSFSSSRSSPCPLTPDMS
jgi:hypothetical protein